MTKRLLFVVNVDWFFLSHRLPIALEAQVKGFDVHIATGITDKSELLESYGLKVHPWGLVRDGLGVLNAIRAAFELAGIFKNVKPDVVHLVTIKPLLLGGLIARWLEVPALVSAVSGLGYVFTSDQAIAKLRRWIVNYLYSFVFGHDNQVIIFQNSDDCETLIKATGFSRSKVKLIRGSGVDLDQHVLTREPSGTPVVMFPARLLGDKGIFEFVQAASLLRAKETAARFVLVGKMDSANPTSVSQDQLDEWIMSGVIEFWGFRADMPRVLASASLVVLPSYREGLPKVLLEAAAGGRAVITTDVPGCRDAIESGVTGLLVPVRDAVGLALAIEQLLANPAQRMAMGLAGRQLAEREFDVRAVVNEHLVIYRDLLARQTE